MLKKLPPEEKAYEAFSAIGDQRITMSEYSAEVKSSDGSKTYTVEWNGNRYTSDDNATFWQGYPGYPVIAVLMKQGRLSCNEAVCEKMKGIPWKQLHDMHKRNYAEAVRDVLDGLKAQGVGTDDITALAETVNNELKMLDIETGRKRKKK